ncbi:hypothetical protein SUGI_0813930 [Cryptomeria japonica]|nr:hypothetical protein SUGI_0813930 [Cryptomeria japonica]
MSESRNMSLIFDWHKPTATNQYPATGANLVPLGKELEKIQEKLSIGGRPYTRDRCEWKPNFDPHSQNLNKCPRWINLGTLLVEYLDFKILEYIGEQFGSFLGCEGLGKEVLNKNIKILVESDINSPDLEPTMLVSNRGEWSIHPTFYDGVINESDIRLKSCPVLINSIEQMENPLPDQYKKITSNASPIHDSSPPVANTEENSNNKSRNISDLDKIIDEANSIKEEALVEMTKRISDSVDSLKFPSETKSVENLGQDNEADQEEMSSRMAAVLEVFDNNVVENLSSEEEAEKRFLIQELLASMDEEENNENRIAGWKCKRPRQINSLL